MNTFQGELLGLVEERSKKVLIDPIVEVSKGIYAVNNTIVEKLAIGEVFLRSKSIDEMARYG